MQPNQYAILASGKLGYVCLKNIFFTQNVVCVLTDKLSKDIHQFCTKHQIPFFSGNPRNEKALNFVRKFKIDVILSINYLFIIEKNIIELAQNCAINFHGSLLPKYRGRTPHVWAIINNEIETGITAHLISEGCDEGDILLQYKIGIKPEYTGAELLKIFENQYPLILKEVVACVEENKLNPIPQNHAQATFFGKRTPVDGLINWNWQKLQIYNWVRAQAHPYPGAFTFYENQKIEIHKIEESNLGYNWEQPNGTILETTPHLVIKTPNGALSLVNVKHNISSFTIGNCLL